MMSRGVQLLGLLGDMSDWESNYYNWGSIPSPNFFVTVRPACML